MVRIENAFRVTAGVIALLIMAPPPAAAQEKKQAAAQVLKGTVADKKPHHLIL